MDFFSSQELARRKTKWLIIYFVLALICMIAGIYLVVMLVMGTQFGGDQEVVGFDLFDPVVLGLVTLSVLTVVGCGSLYKIAELRGGGESVAAMLGGRRLPPNSNDPAERRILNVVEEMALAAGTPVPPVFILDQEPGINAFAAGYTIDDAVIGVNRGTIEQLNRDELQGVVAHEFSHILNGDMRMSIRMIGVLHGIQLLALIGYFILRSGGGGYRSSRDNKGAGGIILVAVGVIVIGSIGLLFARLIKASVSRQREYLADASAVQFTRNPDGIAGALKMIGASQMGSVVESPQAEVASHMYFSSMFRHQFFQMFSTHPPLDNRIKQIDARFDGDYKEYLKSRIHRPVAGAEPKAESKKPGSPRFPWIIGDQVLPEGLSDRFPIDPIILIAGIGKPSDDDVDYSHLVVNHIPPELAEASRDVFSARCIVFAWLLDQSEAVRQEQLWVIENNEGRASAQEALKLEPIVMELDPRLRLPVFEILQGSLAGMSPQQYTTFHATVNSLVEADRKVDLFEFFLLHHLIVHLDRRFGKGLPPQIKFKVIGQVREDICLLLAILVSVGHDTDKQARNAFAAAIDSIGLPWHKQQRLVNQPANYDALAKSLDRLSKATPIIKKRALSAAAVAITHDHKVTVEEAELFRAMAESLDCPVPPVVATVPH